MRRNKGHSRGPIVTHDFLFFHKDEWLQLVPEEVEMYLHGTYAYWYVIVWDASMAVKRPLLANMLWMDGPRAREKLAP